MLLSKLAPGRERLHIRAFELNNGNWMIAAHTDYNWMNLNPFKVVRAHVGSGAGNFRAGTKMMYELFRSFNNYYVNNKIFPYTEISRITRWVYYQTLAQEIKSTFRLALY